MNDEVEDTFTPRSMVLFRTSRKLSSYLVRAKLYPLEKLYVLGNVVNVTNARFVKVLKIQILLEVV